MTTIHVQFSDSSKTKIISAFGSPQDDEAWPNQGEVEDTDQRYVDFVTSLSPSAAEIAAGTRDSLLSEAAVRIAPLQDAADLGSATSDESALLTKWKQYRIDVSRVDLAADPLVWPAAPE